MCTCITYENSSFYFGRNLDLDCSFGERVMITPRNFPLTFRHAGAQKTSLCHDWYGGADREVSAVCGCGERKGPGNGRT